MTELQGLQLSLDAFRQRGCAVAAVVVDPPATNAELARTAALDYPINVGGRPLNSWVSFIPITFELMVLGAAVFALLFGIVAINGLPCPYHPVFNVPEFARASRDRFFVCIEAADPGFDPEDTRRFLENLHPVGVYDVTE